MLNFSKLILVKKREAKDNFVGIRKSASGEQFDFCLPNGFDDFPDGDFNQIRDLFFRMYRTFNKFEKDNKNTERLNPNQPEYQQKQDQISLSSGGVNFQTDDGESCVIYSKIKMIEKILSAYDDLVIHSIQRKITRTDKIDYSQIHRYLDRAIYLEDDVIHIETMDLPRPLLRYESTDLIDLYCFILDEIIQQLEEDVPDNVKYRSQDIKYLSQRFKSNYLNSNQSLFDKDTYDDTISVLKETLDVIDNKTYYKDADYWQLYEAIETFLYGEINPENHDGEYWGIKGFSLVWEDMCNTFLFTYFFQKNKNSIICYADTDIQIRNYQNPYRRNLDEKNKVGNCSKHDGTKTWGRWIYSINSNIPYADKSGNFSWYELLCIEFDPRCRDFVYDANPNDHHSKLSTGNYLRRFLRPDMILKAEETSEIIIFDFKDVPIEFFERNRKLPFIDTDEKYYIDVIKQLTYELALQKDFKVLHNWFLIPFYFHNNDQEFAYTHIDINGIKVVKFNFYTIQKTYLSGTYEFQFQRK